MLNVGECRNIITKRLRRSFEQVSVTKCWYKYCQSIATPVSRQTIKKKDALEKGNRKTSVPGLCLGRVNDSFQSGGDPGSDLFQTPERWWKSWQKLSSEMQGRTCPRHSPGWTCKRTWGQGLPQEWVFGRVHLASQGFCPRAGNPC